MTLLLASEKGFGTSMGRNPRSRLRLRMVFGSVMRGPLRKRRRVILQNIVSMALEDDEDLAMLMMLNGVRVFAVNSTELLAVDTEGEVSGALNSLTTIG